jgi:23S rRNA (guanosine2251-2'-O)-methyltransferase
VGRREHTLGGEQVEGQHAVRQLLTSKRRRTRELWADEKLAHGQVGELVALARGRGARVQLKSAGELAAVAQTSAPQGVIAWADPLPVAPLNWLLELPEAALLVVLDGVTDPGNLGAVLRTAVCAGAGGLVVPRHRSASFSPAALKAAAGAVEVMPVCQVPGIPGALAAMRAAGWWVVGLVADAGDELWKTPLLDERVVLVLGSEGRGLSRLVRQRCDALVRIPMAPVAAGVGSLNIAAACAVACFEVARRRTVPGGTGARQR